MIARKATSPLIPPGALILAAMLAAAAVAGAADDGPFRDEVAPILRDRCVRCHGGTATKGGLSLATADALLKGGANGAAVEPGKPQESPLLEMVTGAAPAMPKGGRPLTAAQVASLRRWIERGAPWPVGLALEAPKADPASLWSLRPIARPPVPAVGDPAWVRTPIDAFLLRSLEAKGLAPRPEADRRTLIRRLTFDLIGLPPTPGEVDAFAADPATDAYERLVDRLLASPRHGERWGRHWLDVVRFAESHGYETNLLRPDAWPYRDYVIRAFNEDTPFARFVEEQFAGDAIPDADGLTRAATGFLVGGAHDTVGNKAVDGMLRQRVDDLDDMITASATTFLGLTVHCARCHDHKFDPIAQRDYYGLQAVFAGVNHASRDIPARDTEARRREAAATRAELAEIDRSLDDLEPPARPDAPAPGRPPVDPLRNVERFAPAEARSVRFTVRATNDGTEPCIDELELWSAGPAPRNLALAVAGGTALASSTFPGTDLHKLEHLNDGRVGNGRSWISAERGKGWVQVDLREPAVIDRVVWGRDREGKYRDRLPVAYAIEVAAEPGRWRVVASSADRASSPGDAPPASAPADRARLIRRRDELREQLGGLGATMRAYAGTFAEPGPTRILHRGDPMQPLEPAVPSGVRAVPPALVLPAGTPEAERRRSLARWIADPANPLPARVMVNRLWHYHFGRGIVGTPSDFGLNGDRPSHPELLDWLAAEFLAGGGRPKAIHRLIARSAAYRQADGIDPKALAADGDDRLLWRRSPRRLEAEEVRDAMLAVAGTLDGRMGGPGYDLWEPNTNYVTVFTPRADLGPDAFRRMVYQFKPRSQPDPTFGVFDCPDGGLVAPRRNVSTTALQALSLLNSRLVLDQSTRFAGRLAREAGPEPDDQARLAFRLAFGRVSTAAEQAAAAALIRTHGGPALCRAIFNANEFLYVP